MPADDNDGTKTCVVESSKLIKKMIANYPGRHGPEPRIGFSYNFVKPWAVETTFVNVITLGRSDHTTEAPCSLIAVVIGLQGIEPEGCDMTVWFTEADGQVDNGAGF